MRTAIAKVTTDSWRTIPHFYISIQVEMERAEKVVQGLKAGGVAVSLNALILNEFKRLLENPTELPA